jgi:hypothetical protein
MVSSSWRIMASPQVVRHEDIASLSIHQAGKRPDIKAVEFFNTTGLRGFEGQYPGGVARVGRPAGRGESLHREDRVSAEAVNTALRRERAQFATGSKEMGALAAPQSPGRYFQHVRKYVYEIHITSFTNL